MKFLTDNTLSLFNELSNYDYFNNFTFVGGSAAAYYLNHRLSDDLDFFTWIQKLPLETDILIKKFLKTEKYQLPTDQIPILTFLLAVLK